MAKIKSVGKKNTHTYTYIRAHSAERALATSSFILNSTSLARMAHVLNRP